jgi:hypothetical protein
MRKASGLLLFLLLGVLGTAAHGYTLYLRDGTRLITKGPPEIRGETAVIVLQNGTRTSLPAAEIDLELTRKANQSDLGDAMVLEGGKFTDTPTQVEQPKRDRLSDLIARNEAGTRSRPQARRPTPETDSRAPARTASGEADLSSLQRKPYRDLEVAGEIQSAFRGQGVEQVRIYQGTRPNWLLIDVTTDSEAAVFRSIRVAASALSHVRTAFPRSVESFELFLSTSNRSPAGQFLLQPGDAAALVEGEIEVSTFFVDNVRF